ncbi:MAG: DUF4012 domain-containing protein [Candidatus Moranbacteria bacterium]|nr:DUF4012 domain-containing protein [Candidatus Moranbacteria bacterium]
MAKKYSKKFWIIFWAVSTVLLVLWYGFLQWKGSSDESMKVRVAKKAIEWTIPNAPKELTNIAKFVLQKDGKERTYLILLQNNHELRPSGGYIGTFAIVKIKDGQITNLETHNTNVFDGRVPDVELPPYPMKETLKIPSWKMRDANWSPDFPTSAKKAEYFYHLGKGKEQFDGIIGVTTNILPRLLSVTGPIELEGKAGIFTQENAIDKLQEYVEISYQDLGVEEEERKVIIATLAKKIVEKVSWTHPITIAKIGNAIVEALNEKEVQIYVKNEKVQKEVHTAKWGGEINSDWTKDYLMTVDANLSALKSDRLIDRNINYTIDLTLEKPRAYMQITYRHNGTQKDWRTTDYQSFLRVYLPKDAWVETVKGANKEVVYEQENGKKVFGALVHVGLGASKTIELEYVLPESIKNDYSLLIQKQAGVDNVQTSVRVIREDGKVDEKSFNMKSDTVVF